MNYADKITEMTGWPLLTISQRLQIIWWCWRDSDKWDELKNGIDKGRTLRSAYLNALYDE